MIHPDLNPTERSLLTELDGIFNLNRVTYSRLSAKQMIGIGLMRQFSPDMMTIAHYTALMYGQLDFPEPTMLHQLYITKFGNIHLTTKENTFTLVHPPEMIYADKLDDDNVVTGLWSYASCLIDGLTKEGFPGLGLCNVLEDCGFMTDHYSWEKTVTIPRLMAAYNSSYDSQIQECSTISVVANAYQSFLYGRVGDINIVRHANFIYILDLMAKRMGESHRNLLFPPASIYLNLLRSKVIHGNESKRSDIFEYALEALDSDLEPDDSGKEVPPESEDSKETPATEEDADRDPSTDDGGFDPAAVPPLSEDTDKDTIELISFNKTGEGIEEDLYRSAVVALNDRIKSDDTVDVTAAVKESLDHWVNGFIYRTAISATKDQIKTLGLQKYLKTV